MLDAWTLKKLRDAAESPELKSSVETYRCLRHMFSDASEKGRATFERRFSTYYGLRSQFLTDGWLSRYFDLFYKFRQSTLAEPYRPLLLDLYEFPRRGGVKTLEFSFVSKLVAFHDETRPLFDRNVRRFFGLGPPDFGCCEFRISGFIDNLNEIARRYNDWLEQKTFAEIIDRLRWRFPDLAARHSVRLCDFLVHKIQPN
jgi:hypothetical protein